jgi:hypothetical protein
MDRQKVVRSWPAVYCIIRVMFWVALRPRALKDGVSRQVVPEY